MPALTPAWNAGTTQAKYPSSLPPWFSLSCRGQIKREIFCAGVLLSASAICPLLCLSLPTYWACAQAQDSSKSGSSEIGHVRIGSGFT